MMIFTEFVVAVDSSARQGSKRNAGSGNIVGPFIPFEDLELIRNDCPELRLR